MENFAEKNFNLDRIAGSIAREEDTRASVARLGSLFNEGSRRLAVARNLRFLYQDVERVIGASILPGGASDNIEVSEPYASFDHGGIAMNQCMARVALRSSPSREGMDFLRNVGGAIYLLGVVGDNQMQVEAHNFSAGVVDLENGTLEFFKLIDNYNQGETYPGGSAIDRREVVVERLNPEEQAAVVTELTQATQHVSA